MQYFLKYLRKPTPSEIHDVKHYTVLMISALIPSGFAFLVFWALYSKGIHLNAIENQMSKLFTFTILGFIYAGQATRAILKADMGFDELIDAVREGNQDKFNKAYHKRISRWHHLFLGTISMFMIGLIMLNDFDSLYSGAIIIVPITYIMTLTMLFAVNLDHASESPLYKKYIPDYFIKNFEKYEKVMEAKLEKMKAESEKTPDSK